VLSVGCLFTRCMGEVFIVAGPHSCGWSDDELASWDRMRGHGLGVGGGLREQAGVLQ
jgi:hypothetical protein